MNLFIDFETNNKADFKAPPEAPHQPRIVQAGLILANDKGEQLARCSFLIKPSGWQIHEEAQKIHGISLKDCEVAGIDIRVAMNLIHGLAQQASLISSHNIAFDFLLLEIEAIRLGKKLTDIPAFAKINRFCTMLEAMPILKLPGKWGNAYKWPSLAETHKHFFGKEIEKSHDAMADVEACAKCYYAIVEHLEHV
jgi:DNA polymerase-3 subunit epsilon